MNPAPQPAAGITPVGCCAEANATCSCGVSYVAKSVRAAEAIKENPGKSDWAIAAELGIGSNTVRRAREDSGAPCGAGEERIGRDGKSYSIRQRIREEAGPLASPRAARRVSLTVCELRHITLPRIGLLCQRFSLTGARRQWRVLFEKRRPSQVAVGNARSRQALMKIVLVAAGPLFIALGLFWFGQAAGLHNAVLIDVGAGVAALGIGLGWFALR